MLFGWSRRAALVGIVGALALPACNQILDNQTAKGILLDGGVSGDSAAAEGGSGADGGCAGHTTLCPGSSACVDLSEDPAHCGTCDRTCEVCQEGTCQPVRVASNLDEPVGLGLDPQYLFALTTTGAATTGTLLRAGLGPGATASPVVTGLDRPSAMAVDPTMPNHVYVAVAAGGGQSKVLEYTGKAPPPEIAALAGSHVGALDFADGKIWGTDLKGARVWQANPDGSAFVAANAAGAGLTLGSIDAAGDVLVIALRSLPCVQVGEILRWSPGTDPAPIGDPVACPAALALVGGDLFVANRQPAPDGSIVRIDDTGRTTSMFTQEDNPTAVAVDGQELFWVDEGSGNNGSVNRAAGGSATKITLATGRAHPVAIAVNASYVFWAERGAGAGTAAVYRIER